MTYPEIVHQKTGYFIIGNELLGLYQKDVGITIQPQYKTITYLGGDRFTVLDTNLRCGLVDRNNQQLLPFTDTYEYVDQYNHGCYVVSRFTDQDDLQKYLQNNSMSRSMWEYLHYGIANQEGKLLLAPEHDGLTINNDGTYTIATKVGREKVGTFDGMPVYEFAYSLYSSCSHQR